MDTYLSTQRSTIFQQVGVMIYVFDVESREENKDREYFRDCMAGLKQHSPDATIFLLIHKMDLVREGQQVFERKRLELVEASEGANVSVFGTSIYDESLYKVCFFSYIEKQNPFSYISLSRHGQISYTL